MRKSRLTAALLERLASEPHTRLRNFCSPQHTDSALYPTIGQIERAAGFTHDDTPKAKLANSLAVRKEAATTTVETIRGRTVIAQRPRRSFAIRV